MAGNMRPENEASNRVADGLAALLSDAFAAYHDNFRDITARARGHFERRDWGRAQADAAGRLALYRVRVEQTVADAQARLGHEIAADPAIWAAAKPRFAARTSDRPDAEIAQTFYNSVARRVLGTVGSDPTTEFSGGSLITLGRQPSYTTLRAERLDATTIEHLMRLFHWSVPFVDLAGDARVAAAIAGLGNRRIDGLDVIRSVFYRNKGAYLVARVRQAGGGMTPLILALANTPEGITIDATLPTADEASVVFGFSWSYFHVDIDQPGALVAFLSSLMPFRRVDELYTAIGYHRHGKTVFYRHLMQHLLRPDARFEVAEGEEGTVMSVFTLPSFNVVFKVIKDAFGPTKTVTRQGVMDRYHFVFVRDRVGRLADAQEFESLEFPVDRFSPWLLDHLLSDCARTVRVERGRVIVHHAYTERRVTPLNLYLKHADPAAARDAVIDYGNAIKDLAAADIFTGDMLLKNFGVTRHGRVVCYDYDELALLTDCHIRDIPPAADLDEEMSAEPYFYVAPQDVFPEEFQAFLVPPGDLRDSFLAAHADLLDVHYWREVQAKVRAGEVLDMFPYRPGRRLAQSR